MSTQIEKFVASHKDQLIRYEVMLQAIAECYRVDEVKEIRDRALALEVYAAQALNTEAERQARDIRIRAEHRAGVLLSEMSKNGQRAKSGDAGGGTDGHGSRSAVNPTLAQLGINSKDQSSKWQQLAKIPDAEFEELLNDPHEMPSTEGILARHAAKHNPPEKLPELGPCDPVALWTWGTLVDFERNGIGTSGSEKVFSEMTEPMQDDIKRIAPIAAEWLRQLSEVKL